MKYPTLSKVVLALGKNCALTKADTKEIMVKFTTSHDTVLFPLQIILFPSIQNYNILSSTSHFLWPCKTKVTKPQHTDNNKTKI